jgi:hypothetical protein
MRLYSSSNIFGIHLSKSLYSFQQVCVKYCGNKLLVVQAGQYITYLLQDVTIQIASSFAITESRCISI